MIMKLKRSPSGMSYDEVRYRQLKDKTDDPEAHAADPESLPETSDAPVSAPATDEADLLPVKSVPVIEHDDDAIEPVPAGPETEPETPSSTSSPAPVDVEDPKASQKAEKSRPAKHTNRPDRPATSGVETDGKDRPRNVIVKGFMAQPASGVSATFDKIAPVYGDKAAMRHLLDVALASFLKELEDGEVDNIQGEPSYAAYPKKPQVSRSISRQHYAILEKKIDPSAILRPGTIGRTIVQGALNRFIANERGGKT